MPEAPSKSASKILATIWGILDYVVDFMFYLACASIAGAFFLVAMEVILRTVANESVAWATEFTEYFIANSTFLGAAWVLKKEKHVIIDIALVMLKGRSRTAINIATSILGTLICLIITWYGASSAWYHFVEGTRMVEKTMGLYAAPLLTVLPVGFFLFTLQFLRRTYDYVKVWKATPRYDTTRFDDEIS